ncbi:MAG: alpha/beta hydrolase [Merismopedia sp. SIO2A8]|nr:alpha/beta hydrolase [Symploca sp. SIO2B6]NET53042.1 alpha/beta hydrolase [Merismopedia sp. SIO2A8]
MLHFHPPGFGQQTIQTTLGNLVYYTPTDSPWTHWTHENNGDRPVLLFLHSMGGGSSAYEWSKVYPAFAVAYRVMAPDLIGWGASAHPPRDYSSEDYVAIITELLESIGRPTTIVATSLTAAFAIRAAIAHPDYLQSLFLVCPSGYDDFGRSYRNGLSAQLAGTPGVDRILYTLGAANDLAVRNFLQQFLFAQPRRITDEMVAAYTASAQQPNAEYAALSALKGSLFFDLARYLDQLTVPTAFIWGKDSKFKSPEFGQRLAALNPKAVKWFEAIAQTGVLPHLECPAVVIGLLQAWLQHYV